MSGDASAIGAVAKALIEGLVSTATDARRLTRGRTYVRDGAVISLEVEPGVVRGDVLGSEPKPYRVALHVPPSAWAISGADAASMDVATLKRLIPEYYRIRWTCTCPDGAEACKHAVAVALSFAQRVSMEPEVLVRWRSTPEVVERNLRLVEDDDATDAMDDADASAARPTASRLRGRDSTSGDRRALHLRVLRGGIDPDAPTPPADVPHPPLSAEMAAFLGAHTPAPVVDTAFTVIELARPQVGAVDIGAFVLDAHLMIRAALRPI